MKKKITLLLILLLIPFQLGMVSYNYSFHGEVLHSSAGYNYITHVNQQSLGVKYSNPRDFVVYEDHVYLLATVDNKDALLILNLDLELVDIIQEFELTPEYEKYVQGQVTETFTLINTFYEHFFEEKIFYPGTKLPMSESDKLIEVAQVSWESSSVSNITNDGKTSNNSDENALVNITLKIELWGQVFENTFTVTIGTLEEGLVAKPSGSKTEYEIDENFEVQKLNELLYLEFDETKYITVQDIIDDFIDRLAVDDEGNVKNEFVYEDYKFTFSENTPTEENPSKYTNIKMVSQVSTITNEDADKIHSSMFEVPYKTKNAYGLDVVDSGIYIADTDNGRIVKLTHDFKVKDTFYDVEDETFKELAYRPIKISVDQSERMYVIARNAYEGIIELDSNGSFNRYTGVNPIKLTPLQILRRMLMTEAQRAKLEKFLPTDYTNLIVDDKNFIYATAKARENNAENMIQLINPKGIDVLTRTGYHPPMGDIMYVEGKNNYVIDGPSNLVDIAIGKNGIYSVLDDKRSRIFTYDSEGNLLYVNGDKGYQSDRFNQGVALSYLNDNLLVLDASGSIVVYRPTEFGESVNKAVELHYNGQFEEAAELWEKVLKLNTNYEVAYNGIGKYHLRLGNYKEAMANFKLGHDQFYYSKAFKNHRNQIIKKNFTWIFMGVIVLVISIPVYKNRKKIFRKRGDQ